MERTPRRIPEAAPSGPLAPEEQRVYDAIDGQFAEAELALVVGLPPESVGPVLDALVAQGLVTFEAEPVPEVEEPQAHPDYADGIELSRADRDFFEDYARRIKTDDHYELLGLWRDATKDEVKKAYYKLAPRFHPDKYYGRELGHYKALVAEVFDRLTAAHDTLRYKKKRAAYDASLPPMRPGARMRRRPEPSDPGRASSPGPGPSMAPSGPGQSMPPDGGGDAWAERQSDPGRISQPGPSMAPQGRPSTHPGASRPSRPSIPSMSPAARRRMRRTSRQGQLDPEQRRIQAEALARRLGKAPPKAGGGRRPRRGGAATEVRTTQKSAEELAERQSGSKRSAAEVYRDRYNTVGTTAKETRLQKYLQQGYTYMEEGDYRAALAAFQQALRLSPGDQMIEENIQRATKAAMGG